MAGKRTQRKSHTRLKLAGSVTILATAALLLIPLIGTAGAGSVAVPASAKPEEPSAPWGLRLPSVAQADVCLKEDYSAFLNTAQISKSSPVDDTYFADAVFLGDSRTEGFKLYSGLTTGTFFYSTGANVESVVTRATWKTSNGKVSLLDAMSGTSPAKVYVMLGVNELGWPRNEMFHQRYAKVIQRIRADHPDAEIVLQSILPVTAAQEAKGTYVNNGRIREYNQIIETLATEENCHFLNVAEAVTDADGFLPEDLAFDGVHLNRAGCRLWLEYLKNHSI